MEIAHLLFNTNGRIGVRPFFRGIILLTGFLIVAIIVEAFGPPVLSGMVSFLVLGSVYSYHSVFAKRLHDSGRSAWWFLAILVGFLVFSNLVNAILMSIFTPQVAELTEEMWYLIQRGDGREAMGHMAEINKMTIIPRMVTLIAGNALFAYIGSRLRSEPAANQYGEPTTYRDSF